MSTLPPGEDPIPPPVIPPDPCNAPACTGAKAELNTARAMFTSACRALTTVTSVLRFLRPFITVNLWIVIVVVILAVVLWLIGLGFLAVVLWVLIVIYGIAWLLTLIFARVAASLTQDLAKHSQEVADAIAKVTMSCPENCRGDLSVPTCNP